MKVMVRAFSRLHLGLFELGGHFGRRFGGTGVYIQRPGLTVAIENSPQKTVVGDHVQLAIEATEAVETYFGRKFTGRMTVSSEIPVHRGFGSVTQLKLAVATAVLATWNIVVEPARLAP
ncbi:MAG: hypothetical protein NZ581_06010, partial [Candidatus Caldarchaeum sp.]|nr:hypothetical protein [Candidatus Caldarchaeum sp.]MDW8435735.1 hypothetical protein [Candidatus Caldarchaeum sp.]